MKNNFNIFKQLKKCNISGEIWVDAGCGIGTYTFALSTLVSKVYAIDINKNDITYLASKLGSLNNIIPKIRDFNNSFKIHELVDGILFAFSLHYSENPTKALRNSFKQLKENGKLVIIDYSSEKTVPWVPFPQPKNEVAKILEIIGFEDIKNVLEQKRSRKFFSWDNSSYILTAKKRKYKK